MGSEKEIERRWIIKDLPGKDLFKNSIRCRVGYVFNEGGELRVLEKFKPKETKHYLTIKTDGTLERDEWQEKIPEWAFKIVWPQTKHNRLLITRHFICWYNLLEIDEYHGRFKGLIKLEVEFEEDWKELSYPLNRVDEFQLPDWIGPSFEVTNDVRFNNKNLAGLDEEEAKALMEEVSKAWIL